MSKLKWNSGPPPHQGWWRTDCGHYARIQTWRWWDGEYWNFPVFSYERGPIIDVLARQRTTLDVNAIKWCDYWPPGARVPRINPRSGK